MNSFQLLLSNAQLTPSPPADQVAHQTESVSTPIPTESLPLIESAATIIQIAFWVLVGTLSLLTYLHARRTFFQPLKTEVFKLQLASLTRISEFFHGKGEMDLLDDFALVEMVQVNSWRFLDQYAHAELHAVSDLKDEMKRLHESPKNRMSVDFKPTWRVDQSRRKEASKGSRPFQSLIGISVPAKQMETIRKLESLNADPLIPAEVSKLVDDLLVVVHQNIEHIHTVFDPLIPRMLDLYPDIETLNATQYHWMHNLWNADRENLEPVAQAVLMKIRDYYQPDLIGFAKRDRKSKFESGMNV